MNSISSSAPQPLLPHPAAAKSSDELAQIRTDLAIDRTLMAADRSLMAWVRTALSMISFGFTIYKILESFQQQGGALATRSHVPRDIGLFLTGLGTIAMVMGTLEYWYRLKALRESRDYGLVQPSLVMALIISAAGSVTFAGIVFRLL